MASTTEIQGIKFFSDRNSCIANFNKTSAVSYAIQVIKNFGNLFSYAGSLVMQRCKEKREKSIVTNFMEVPSQGFSKQKLVVCLHGRNNHPRQFAWILKEMLQKQTSDRDIYIPAIRESGKAAKLDDMVTPILKEIEKWAKDNHDKELELDLVGISNGGRIARAIEAKIGGIKNIKKFRLVSIVGACKGSMMANIANSIGLRNIVGEDVRVEMPVNSQRNQRLNKEWAESFKASPDRQRHYVCIASGLDFYVPNYSSTLLEVPDPKAVVQYGIVADHGHNSIVSSSAKAVASFVA